MEKRKGRFIPGTEHHWRPHAIFREKAYLEAEYLSKQRSAADIAKEHGVVTQAIHFWLVKHGIPRRNVSEARKAKRWTTPSGPANPMYGRKGPLAPQWKGGCTPDRQLFYSSIEWNRAARAVRKRDRCTCQRCGKTQKDGVIIEIHHKVSFAVVELRAVLSNLVLLCTKCHDWVHGRKNVNKEFLGEA